MLETLKSKKAIVGMTAGAVLAGGIGAVPAIAAVSTPQNQPSWSSDAPRGVVLARGGLFVRKSPSTKGKPLDLIKRGTIVRLACKKAGQDVDGNGIWYKLADQHGYISARYTKNVDHVNWC